MDELLVACPIDSGKDFRVVYTVPQGGRTFSIVACKKCGLQMINPQPTPEVLSSYYDERYYGKGTKKFIPIITWLRRLSVKKKVRKISSFYAHRTGKVIDIGCADGAFLFNIMKRKWDVYGSEHSESFATSPYLHDIKVHIGDIDTLGADNCSFDVVTLWHVFEHLADPNRYLREINRIIKPNGLLVLTLPNIDSWQAKLFKAKWFHLDPPRHLFHFSPATLRVLLKKNNFTVERIEHFSLEYNPYGFIQSLYNLTFGGYNHLYEFLKNTDTRILRQYPLQIVTQMLLLVILVPVSIVFAIFEAGAKKGGTIKVYIRKKNQ